MWVRPVYDARVWPDGDDRRLFNLDHYRIVRVTEAGFGARAGWAVEAIVETTDRHTVASEIQGRTALLAAVPSEAAAVALFERVQQGLATGVPLLDLPGRPAA